MRALVKNKTILVSKGSLEHSRISKMEIFEEIRVKASEYFQIFE